MTGSDTPAMLHLAIAPAERPQQVGARHLEPHEVVRVVDHAHLIGFGVADPQRGDDEGIRTQPRRIGRGAQLAHGALGVARPEDGLARDQDVGAGGHDARRGPRVDAAVDLDGGGAARRDAAGPAPLEL